MPLRLKVHAALFTVATLFSLNYIISKLGMHVFSPLAFAWLRVAGSALVLNAVVARRAPPFSRADLRQIAGFAVLGVLINQTMFLTGLSLTSAHIAAILITTIPVFALAAAIVLGRERATASKIGGIALAAAGALLVLGGTGFEGSAPAFLGALFITINCLSYALYLVVSKPAMARMQPTAMVARMFAFGTALILPFALPSLLRQEWRSIPLNAWLALLAVIAGPTVSAYVLNAWALRHADSSLVAAYTYVQPVLTTIMAAVFLQEHLEGAVAVAAVMIFVGVALAGRQPGPIPE